MEAGAYRVDAVTMFHDRRKQRRFWRIIQRAERRLGCRIFSVGHNPNIDAWMFFINFEHCLVRGVHLTGLEQVENGQSAPRWARIVVARIIVKMRNVEHRG